MKTEAIRILEQFKDYIASDSQWLTANDTDQMLLKTNDFIQYISNKYDRIQQNKIEDQTPD